MNNKKEKWVSISIFTARENTDILLDKYLYPIILSLLNSKKIFNFQISLNNNAGENIRLMMLVIEEELLNVPETVQNGFNSYLKKQNLTPVYSKGPFKSVFMPYPQNTIQFGVFSTFRFETSGDIPYLKQAFSESMLAIFRKEPVNRDMILTFGIYVLLDTYRLLKRSNLDTAKEWYTLYKVRLQKAEFSKYDRKNLKIRLMEQTAALDEIYMDIAADPTGSSYIWLGNWRNALMQQQSKIFNKKDTKRLFNILHHIIRTQLGIGAYAANLLSFLIFKTLKKQEDQFLVNAGSVKIKP